MNKSEKKVLTVIILVIIIFISGITASAFISRTENHSNTVQITIGDARAIALKDAGKTETAVAFSEQEQEKDHGLYTYEIEFSDGFTKYEYEINAQSGEIISRYAVKIH
ncbi:MAG: PepSY domain-containing protein [Clostridium sp.]|nr:PepSY domain-containing protein [Clostridium sp.]